MNRSLSLLSLLFLLVSALQGAGCVVKGSDDTPCDPNPCTEAHRGTCVAESGEARCLCDAGFITRPSGACEAVSASNCAEHPGDFAEPDDCQARARPLPIHGARLQQSIDPAGDYDFFQFNASARELFSLSVKADSGALMPRVDVFDQGGVWRTASEAPGRTELFFRAHVAAPYFVRVSHSPVDPSVGTGNYTLFFESLGQDDHGDFPDEATGISPEGASTPHPRSIYGRFEYPRDVDWFRFDVTQGRTYRILFDPGESSSPRTVPAVSIYAGSNFRQPVIVSQSTDVTFTAPVSATLFLVMTPPHGVEGSYAFNFLVN
jgi:hypothetical protein